MHACWRIVRTCAGAHRMLHDGLHLVLVQKPRVVHAQ